jgi:hypothetical protein
MVSQAAWFLSSSMCCGVGRDCDGGKDMPPQKRGLLFSSM